MNNILYQNKIFAWISIATLTILTIPLVAMQFTNEVNWGLMDFLIMGILLFSTSSLFILIARRVAAKHRIIIGSICVLVFIIIWIELAVGLFT